MSDEEFDIKFEQLSLGDKADIIRKNLPGLMKIVANEDEAIDEIIKVTTKSEWKKMLLNTETNETNET